MTPFGAKLRALRKQKGVTLSHMAEALGVSAAYLSALEHGRRGTPSAARLHAICGYFNIIWDEVEELAALARRSDPRVVVDTAGLSPEATLLANELAARIRDLPKEKVTALLAALTEEGQGG